MKRGYAGLFGERHRTFALKRFLSFFLFEFIPRCKQRGIQIYNQRVMVQTITLYFIMETLNIGIKLVSIHI